MNPRCLILGLDGATFDLLDALMRDGVMPFLGRFMDSGARADLQSVIPRLTPPAWTSLMTGRSPAWHGVLDFMTFESPDDLHTRFATSRQVACETIWSMANRRGRRVTCLNFPVMWPPPPIQGNLIPGWVPWRWLRRGSRPHDLFDRLRSDERIDPNALAYWPGREEKAIEGCPSEEYSDWIREHIRRDHQWSLVLSRLMKTDPCELTAIVFDGVDKIQHLCWRFLDPEYSPQTPEPRFDAVRSLCLDYYRQLDGWLEELTKAAGDETTVMIVSDHGFGPTETLFSANTWLEQKGYLVWAHAGPPAESGNSEHIFERPNDIIRRLDRSRSRACALTPGSNGIFLLVDGRRGPGALTPEQVEPFRRQLSDELLAIKNPASGEPVVRRVFTREEAFDGPFMSSAPDLTLELQDHGLISTTRNPDAVAARKSVMGCHRPHGVFAARGPGIRKGLKLDPLSILDVAPAVLYALGLPIPNDMEGRVAEEMYSSARLKTHPLVEGESVAPAPPGESPLEALDAEDEKQLAARMKELGYLE